jgi:hypothetical protein
MNKIFGISLIAVLTVSPLTALAEGTNPTAATTSSEPYLGMDITDADRAAAASAAYVKGAYNATIGAINAIANTANGAVQSVTEGTTNGTINVDNTEVSVHGLGTAAFTDTTAYATNTQGTKADNAVQTVKINGTSLTEDANHDVNLTITTGSSAGTIAVNGTNVAVNGVVTDLTGYATETYVTDEIDNATGSVDNVSLSVSGSVTGSVSGYIPVWVNWGDTTANTTNIALVNGTLNNGQISNGATATGNITGIDIAVTYECPYEVPDGVDYETITPDDIGGCDQIVVDSGLYCGWVAITSRWNCNGGAN